MDFKVIKASNLCANPESVTLNTLEELREFALRVDESLVIEFNPEQIDEEPDGEIIIYDDCLE